MDIIEQSHIHRRFARALDSYDQHAEAQHRISHHLAALLVEQAGYNFSRVLEIGCGTGGFTRCLKSLCQVDEWVLNDLCPECASPIRRLLADTVAEFVAGDAEAATFQPSFDLVASASAFQWLKKPEVFMKQMATLLRPEGTLLFSTFSPGNLQEVLHLTGCGLHYPTPAQLAAWLRPHFHLLHTEEEEITLRFDHPLDVLRHLKYTGVTATAGDTAWTRSRQAEFCDRYARHYTTDNQQVTLTYRPLYMVAVKKTEST